MSNERKKSAATLILVLLSQRDRAMSEQQPLLVLLPAESLSPFLCMM